ncbi:MAG: hypothetical protein HZC28_04955 [Spirochaetes bacterium]|nr:hypothetical protein [Spirochaetota bacterium]
MSVIYFDSGVVHDNTVRAKAVPGSTVAYTLIRRLSPDKAIIHVFGKNVLADIPADYPDRGRARVSTVGSRIELTLLKEQKSAPAAATASGATAAFPDERAILLANGVKADTANAEYLATITKHLPAMSMAEKALLMSLIARGIYPSAERLELFFSHAVPLRLRDTLLRMKGQTGKDIKADALKKLYAEASIIPLDRSAPEKMAAYVGNNGYFALLAFLLGLIQDENAHDMADTLSYNKPSPKDGQIMLPFFIEYNGDIHFVEFHYAKERGGKKETLRFSAYEDDEHAVDISFTRENGGYAILLAFLNRGLYELAEPRLAVLSRRLSESGFGKVYRFRLEARFAPREV